MGRTRRMLDPPARRRGTRGRGCRMRDDEARRCHFAGGEAQAARRHKIEFIEDADDHGEARALQAFLDRVQSVAGTRRLDDDQACRIKTEMSKACQRGRTEFGSHRFWPAPEHPGLSCRSRRRQRGDPARRETYRETDACHPICRRGSSRDGGGALDLMDRICLESCGQQIVGRAAAQVPALPSCRMAAYTRGAGRPGRSRWTSKRSVPLQAQNPRAEPCDHRGFPGGAREIARANGAGFSAAGGRIEGKILRYGD